MLAWKKDSRLEGKKKILFLFPPIENDERVEQGVNVQISKGMKESKGPLKEEKKIFNFLQLLPNIHISGFAFTFVGYFCFYLVLMYP